MFYKIVSKSTQMATLSIPKESEIAGLYKDGAVITIFAGKKSKKVTINITDEGEKDTIKVSKEVLNDLYISEGITYQLIDTDKGIRIGPIIGLLMFSRKIDIKSKTLKGLLDYTLSYNRVKGLLYVFSVDGIDFNAKKVNGFYYNPSEQSWVEGILPFPDAIYRRISVSEKTLGLLKSATENRVYNAAQFNKLNFWNMASSHEQISAHLPMTKAYQSIHDIDEMFERHKVLYLKPINSTRAFGLMRITKKKNVYSIQEKMAEKPEFYHSNEEVKRYIENVRKGRKYLVQEGIDLINFDKRYVDFRVIMQKDHLLSWKCVAVITSIGKKGGVCSNYNIDDKYMSFEDFFDLHFNIPKAAIFQKKQEIIMLCMQACKILDESGEYYADLGIDVGLDKNLKPWIFEMNNRRHEHKMSLFINDYDSYFRTKSNPILYGVKLSGFHVL